MAMEKGYSFDKTKCPICEQMISDNWWIRHFYKVHGPLPEKIGMRTIHGY